MYRNKIFCYKGETRFKKYIVFFLYIMSPPIEWTILEKLLLTQAVHKYGENMWFQVARVLKQNELLRQQDLKRPSDFYNQKVQPWHSYIDTLFLIRSIDRIAHINITCLSNTSKKKSKPIHYFFERFPCFFCF